MKGILVLNAGSSSLKYALFKAVHNRIESLTASGIIEEIGQNKKQHVKHKDFLKDDDKSCSNQPKVTKLMEENLTHKEAMQLCLSLLTRSSSSSTELQIDGVGHRVVHGGERLCSPCLVTGDVLKAISEAIPLAPLHNPANLHGINTSLEIFPDTVKQVAVFDTAFHSTMPPSSYLYALSYKLYSQHGIRRYGFHGTSHQYVLKEAAKYLKRPVNSLNVISCHLGAGSSVCCIRNGQSVDTSMGMTPLEGLVMATRSGDIDPSVVFHLIKQTSYTVDEVENLLLNQSGWGALAGTTDARKIEQDTLAGQCDAKRATEIIVHRIRKYLGAYFWQLGGRVDAILFTGGLGENWPDLRKLCLKGCDKFGIQIDDTVNKAITAKSELTDISTSQSEVKVLVVQTNEELSIAKETLQIIAK